MKSVLDFIFPRFLFAVLYVLLGLSNYLKMLVVGVRNCKICEEKIIIIGNGPSLNKTMEENAEIIKATPCGVVNSFANSPYFETIKPKFYFFADPVFFGKIEDQSERIQGLIRSLLCNLQNKISWDIIFVLPFSAKGSDFQKALSGISTAKFQYYNNRGYSHYIPECRFRYILWNYDIISPISQSVLNTALSLCIKSKVKNIYLVGADSSWLTTYEIDQNDNTLYTKDEHFYGVNRIPLYRDENLRNKLYIHDEIASVSNAFKAYYVLFKYAVFNNVNLYNASAYSWIDSLPRRPLV